MTDVQLMELIGKSTGSEPCTLSMKSHLVEDARFDSLSILIFLALLEKEYGLRLSMPTGMNLNQLTIGGLFQMICEAEAAGKGSGKA